MQAATALTKVVGGILKVYPVEVLGHSRHGQALTISVVEHPIPFIVTLCLKQSLLSM